MEIGGIEFGNLCLRVPVTSLKEPPDTGKVGRPFFYSFNLADWPNKTSQDRVLSIGNFIIWALGDSSTVPQPYGFVLDCVDVLEDCGLDQMKNRVLGICSAMKTMEDLPLMLQVTYNQLLKLDAAELLDDEGYDALCVVSKREAELANRLITLFKRSGRQGISLKKKSIVTRVASELLRKQLRGVGVGSIETYAG